MGNGLLATFDFIEHMQMVLDVIQGAVIRQFVEQMNDPLFCTLHDPRLLRLSSPSLSIFIVSQAKPDHARPATCPAACGLSSEM
jgi:hypothetical protein